MDNVKQNLEKRGFVVQLFDTASEAVDYLNNAIDGTTVAFGGSVSLGEMNLFEVLSEHNEVWNHNNTNQAAEYGADFVRKKAMTTDVYISSVNGLSADGKLINIDGAGNRIASTAFGHKKVYFVIGKNKLADDFEGALWRARNIAAPKNAQRLGRNTPCAIKGDKCYNCNSPEKICRGILVIEAPMIGQEAEIILVNENLGY